MLTSSRWSTERLHCNPDATFASLSESSRDAGQRVLWFRTKVLDFSRSSLTGHARCDLQPEIYLLELRAEASVWYDIPRN